MAIRFTLLISLLMCSCTVDADTSVIVEEVNVGPQLCDLVDEFANPVDLDWQPYDGGACGEYNAYSTGDCPRRCDDHTWCSSDYYCEYSIEMCVPKITGGPCNEHDQCTSEFCACGRCLDMEKIVSLGMGLAE